MAVRALRRVSVARRAMRDGDILTFQSVVRTQEIKQRRRKAERHRRHAPRKQPPCAIAGSDRPRLPERLANQIHFGGQPLIAAPAGQAALQMSTLVVSAIVEVTSDEDLIG